MCGWHRRTHTRELPSPFSSGLSKTRQDRISATCWDFHCRSEKEKWFFLHSPLLPQRPLRQTNRKNERNKKAFIFFLFLFLPLCNSFHQKRKTEKKENESHTLDSKVIFSTVAFHTPKSYAYPYPRTTLLLNTQFILYFFSPTLRLSECRIIFIM